MMRRILGPLLFFGSGAFVYRMGQRDALDRLAGRAPRPREDPAPFDSATGSTAGRDWVHFDRASERVQFAQDRQRDMLAERRRQGDTTGPRPA